MHEPCYDIWVPLNVYMKHPHVYTCHVTGNITRMYVMSRWNPYFLKKMYMSFLYILVFLHICMSRHDIWESSIVYVIFTFNAHMYIHNESCHYIWVSSRVYVISKNTHTLWVLGLFCLSMGLFCVSMGLFCVSMGLFCVSMGLFHVSMRRK